jgi:DnaJ-domain-containing protein 1
VTDYFRLLNEPRRPGLNTALLRQKFLALAAEFHPDRVHQASEAEKAAANRHYAELNAAWQCLNEPKSRLLHLLELERGAKPADIQSIPVALADLFASISEICRQADVFLWEREKVTSPLLKIQWFERAQEWIAQLNSWQKKLGEMREQLNTRLESLDHQWARDGADDAKKPAILARLEELYRFYGYFNRWQNQLQERVARLSF